MRDIQAMLKDSGSRMISQKGHYKFELPNGKLFVFPKTPSDYRGVRNCLSALRRELRLTHPAIADRGRNTTRKKLLLSSTIGDLLKAKEQNISPQAAIPGSQPVPEKEIEYTIVDMPEEMKAEPQQETVVHQIPRKPRSEEKPKPASYRTLNREQIAEANRILHEDGTAAMDAYIRQCQTEEHFVASRKFNAPVSAEVHTTSEEDFMTQLLERARLELDATNTRLADYENQFAILKTKQDQDVIKQTQLEQFIAKHESLAAEAAELLPLLPVLPAAAPEKISRRAPNRGGLCGYGITVLRERVFPRLSGKDFNAEDVLRMAQELPLPGPHPTRAQMLTWLQAESARAKGRTIERTGSPGLFRNSAPLNFIPSSAPATQVAHA
jgi:hypothetical protein